MVPLLKICIHLKAGIKSQNKEKMGLELEGTVKFIESAFTGYYIMQCFSRGNDIPLKVVTAFHHYSNYYWEAVSSSLHRVTLVKHPHGYFMLSFSSTKSDS